MMANAIRALAMDAVQQANSGHPGAPMGMADMAVALWGGHLQAQPGTTRNWFDRDRFVLSNGHGSMLIYAVLHLTGYDLPIDELQELPPAAQQDRRPPRSTAYTPGVETTTGPLGQGIDQRRRHGAGREAARQGIQPRTATPSSTTTPMCSWATAA